MVSVPDHGSSPAASPVLSNAEIADLLASLVQLPSAQIRDRRRQLWFPRGTVRLVHIRYPFRLFFV